MTSPIVASPRPSRGAGAAASAPSGHRLQGNLSVVDLPSLLQMMALHGMRGTLTVCRHGFRRTLGVDRGSVTLADPVRSGALGLRLSRPRLGEILMLHGMVHRHDLENAVETQRLQPARERLGDLLVARGAILSDDLTRALAFQANEEMHEVMRWRDGTFDFKPGHAANSGGQIPTPIYPLVLEAAHRKDEWSRIHAAIPSPERVAVRSPGTPPPASGTDRVTNAVLSLSDGRHTVAEIISQAGFPEFDASEAMARTIEQGRVILDSPAAERIDGRPRDDSPRMLVIGAKGGFAGMWASQLRSRSISAQALRPDDGPLDQVLQEMKPRVVVLGLHDSDADVTGLIALSHARGARVLALIAEPTRELVRSLLQQGADDVVVMPVTLDRMVTRLHRLALPDVTEVLVPTNAES